MHTHCTLGMYMYTHPIPGIKDSSLLHEGTRWYVCEVEAHAVVILTDSAQALTGRLVAIIRSKYVRMVLQPVEGAVHSTAFKLRGGEGRGGEGRGGEGRGGKEKEMNTILIELQSIKLKFK